MLHIPLWQKAEIWSIMQMKQKPILFLAAVQIQTSSIPPLQKQNSF